VRDVDPTQSLPIAGARRRRTIGSAVTRDALVAALALATGIGAAVLVVGSDREPTPTWASAGLALLVGWAYVGSGLAA
jgi:hypothetical protein